MGRFPSRPFALSQGSTLGDKRETRARRPNGDREIEAFSGLNQSEWLPLYKVQAAPEVRAVSIL